MAIDFRNGAGTPRSGRQRIGSYLWLLRVFDKARAAADGTLDDYIYPCPMDRGMLERWGVTPAEFDAAVATRRSDAEIYAWLDVRAPAGAAARANAWLLADWRENLERQDREERGGAIVTSGPLCAHCGVAYPADRPAPEYCPICADERVQAPPHQTWTTLQAVAATHPSDIRAIEPGVLAGIGNAPAFAIGQRALIVHTSEGCILWDCISTVDGAAMDYIEAHGGLHAIAISHPHFYGAMSEWSAAFGGVPVYVHAADREWVVNPTETTVFWQGETLEIAPGVTIVRCGGHFDGAAVLHVAAAANGRGALLTGDTIMVGQHGRGLSFMRSYPGYIPLQSNDVRHIAEALAGFRFAAVYGGWWHRVIAEGGDAVLAATTERYLGVLAS